MMPWLLLALTFFREFEIVAMNTGQYYFEGSLGTHYIFHQINSVINEFQKGKYHGNESFIIPPNLFGIVKPFITLSPTVNGIKSKNSLKKFQKFTNDGFRVVITWESRNI